MEARTILLTSLVFALWTSTTTGQAFCTNLADGSYCQHCMQPVDCVGGVQTTFPLCDAGKACTVGFGASYCVPHTQTECACAGTGPQCDAYNFVFIVQCDDSGPFRVDPCPSNLPICYNDECMADPAACIHNAWNMAPGCTGAYYCDGQGLITNEVDCDDGEYMSEHLDCVPGPPAACEGSCSGRCPNPVDCNKYFVCNGTTVVSSGSCPGGSKFDCVSYTCINAGYTCTYLDGCDLEIGIGTPGGGGTTPSPGISTPTTTTSTTTTPTDGSVFPPPAPGTCNSSTVNSKLPYANCSQLYWSCRVEVNDQYKYVLSTCLGDLYFDTNTSNPYCTYQADIATCQ